MEITEDNIEAQFNEATEIAQKINNAVYGQQRKEVCDPSTAVVGTVMFLSGLSKTMVKPGTEEQYVTTVVNLLRMFMGLDE